MLQYSHLLELDDNYILSNWTKRGSQEPWRSRLNFQHRMYHGIRRAISRHARLRGMMGVRLSSVLGWWVPELEHPQRSLRTLPLLRVYNVRPYIPRTGLFGGEYEIFGKNAVVPEL
jgi:hypothetical protein